MSAIGANDRLNIAVVGTGGMGRGHVNHVVELEQEQNVKLVAVCDVYQKARNKAAERAGLAESAVYGDYRKLLENKDIDVVVIATPDHWHAQIANDAMESGKHVYVEKPMTRHLDEAFKMRDVAKKNGKLVQVGSQGCTDAKWHTAGKLVREGKIGKFLWAQGSYCRQTPNGEWNYYKLDSDANEQTLDWKMWLGNAPQVAWSPERCFRWRKYWDYGTGIIGDLWPHRLHPLIIATGIDEFPKRVACVGSNIVDSDKGVAERRDVADTTILLVEFPSGAQMTLAGATVNEQGFGDIIRGSKATLYFGGGKVEIRPERPYTDELEAEDVPIVGPGEDQKEHHRNFWNCIRNGGKPNCDIDLALRVQTIVNFAEKSYRENRMINIDDPDIAKIVGKI